MAQALREAHKLESYFKERYPARPIVAHWREPYSRIESTYRMYKVSDSLYRIMKKGETFEEFVRKAIKHEHDPHRLPMYEVASDKHGKFVPTIIVKWDFQELSRIFELGRMPKLNVSRPSPTLWTPELKEAYRERYARDFEIWEG